MAAAAEQRRLGSLGAGGRGRGRLAGKLPLFRKFGRENDDGVQRRQAAWAREHLGRTDHHRFMISHPRRSVSW